MLSNPAPGSDRLPESAFRTPVFIGVRTLDRKWALLPLGRHGGANRSSLRKEGFSAPMLQARARAPAVQRYGDCRRNPENWANSRVAKINRSNWHDWLSHVCPAEYSIVIHEGAADSARTSAARSCRRSSSARIRSSEALGAPRRKYSERAMPGRLSCPVPGCPFHFRRTRRKPTPLCRLQSPPRESRPPADGLGGWWRREYSGRDSTRQLGKLHLNRALGERRLGGANGTAIPDRRAQDQGVAPSDPQPLGDWDSAPLRRPKLSPAGSDQASGHPHAQSATASPASQRARQSTPWPAVRLRRSGRQRHEIKRDGSSPRPTERHAG